MDHVLDEDLEWIRRGTGVGRTIRSAIPDGYEVYGLLDLSPQEGATEDVLVDALAPGAHEQLTAGWIDRGPWMPRVGDDRVLYAGWHYRFRHVRVPDLRGLPAEREGGFPDLLFPPDRSWLLSLLWDDSWRSVGVSEAAALEVERLLPSFERISPGTDLASTGREVR